MKQRINLISLGCSKNLVDSERLLKMLEDKGFEVSFESEGDFDAVIVNTCGFIGDAKEQSINTILNWIRAKEEGRISKLLVMGCLSERYRTELPTELPEVDGWFGKFNWPEVITFLTKEMPKPTVERHLTTPPHYAYIKIAEGCNRFCAFCAIPLITGRYKSRPIEDICNEVKALVAKGVSEFNIIAQDLSYYGKDIYGEYRIAALVEALSEISGVKWIRLHYLYPHDFPYDLLDVMARKENVCKYMDIALQHSSDAVLKKMRRHIDHRQTEQLLAEIRRRVPGIHIRTTLMVGFPGEGDNEFEELMEFTKAQRFERMGAFAYCEEDDTYAALNYNDSIPQEIKQQRLGKLMALQEQISDEIQQTKIGKTIEVVIDRVDGEYYSCRSQFDSPEVDPEILVKNDNRHAPGTYHNVRITGALPFELIGEFV